MSTKTILITGANGGIGSTFAKQAATEYQFILVGRDLFQPPAEIQESVVKVYGADLATRAGIEKLIKSLEKDNLKPHGVVHAAGALFRKESYSDEGIEMTLALQVRGKYLLSLLLAQSKAGANLEFDVFIAGGGTSVGRYSFENFTKWQGIYHPSLTILKATYFDDVATLALEEHVPKVRHINYGPGIVKTDLSANMAPILRTGIKATAAVFGLTPEEAAHDIYSLITQDYEGGHYTHSLKNRSKRIRKRTTNKEISTFHETMLR